MTLDEFFAELERTPRNWKLINERIRLRDEKRMYCPACPICAVGNSLKGEYIASTSHFKVARIIGLDMVICDQIAFASDGYFPSVKELRARLLKACGLAGSPT